MIVSGARLSSPCWEIRGFAALPRDRCAFSFSQSLGREHFYTGSNLNWCRLNLFRQQGRRPRSANTGKLETVAQFESFFD